MDASTLSPPNPPAAPPPPPASSPTGGRAAPTPRARAAWKVAASIASVAVLLWGVSLAVTQIAHEEHTTTVEFDAAGLTTLDVRIDSGSLTVVGTDGDLVKVTARVSDGLRSTSERQTVNGDQLELRGSCPGFLSSFCNVDYTVEVPARMIVRARLDNDGIRLSGMTGDVDLRTSNGGITVRGSGEGTVSMRSDNGSVTGSDLRAAVVDAHSDNGAVSLSFADAPRAVEATGDNGDITVTVPDDASTYAVTTSSSNGSTAAPIRTDPGSSRRITAKSNNGDVLVTYGSR
jgi:hypothetical protein